MKILNGTAITPNSVVTSHNSVGSDNNTEFFDAYESDTNKTNSTNCTGERINEVAGDPIAALCSFPSIIANLLVILVISQMMKQKILPKKNVFLILTISDLGVSVVYALFGVLDWCFDTCSMNEFLLHGIFYNAQAITVYSNRGVIIYVTLMRAMATSTTKVKSYRDKSLHRIAIELSSFAILACIPVFAHYVTKSEIIINLIVFFYFIIITALMFTLVGYIFIKLGYYNSHSVPSTSTTKCDFQKLVALVALFFCFCNVMGVVYNGYRIKGKTEIALSLNSWFEIAVILNSAVNLFIFVAVSRSFRRALVQLFHGCRKGEPPDRVDNVTASTATATTLIITT